MRHEVINSIGVIAGLLLAGFTAWHQLAPKSDTITVATEGRVNVGSKLEIEPFGTIDPSTGKNQPVLGPVTWKIRVHNPSDRSVSLVGFEAFLLAEDGSPINYTTMQERLSPLEPSLPAQSLPENIPANEGRAYLVSLFVPFVADDDSEDRCGNREIDLRELERCFFRKGRDIFGNRMQYSETEGGGFVAIMQEAFKGPKFAVLLETADGSRFNTQLSFLPGGL